MGDGGGGATSPFFCFQLRPVDTWTAGVSFPSRACGSFCRARHWPRALYPRAYRAVCEVRLIFISSPARQRGEDPGWALWVLPLRARSGAHACSLLHSGAQPTDLARTRTTSPGPEQGLRVKSTGGGGVGGHTVRGLLLLPQTPESERFLREAWEPNLLRTFCSPGACA